jgi:hypothetical protein
VESGYWGCYLDSGFPKALPIEDVIAAILLSFLSMGLIKYLKL